MPVLGCGAEMAKLMDVSGNDVAIIEDTIAERLAMGFSQAQAQRQAVDEALAQLREERAMVMAAIDDQLGQDEPDRVEDVTNQDDVVGNQGGRSADDSTPGVLKDENGKPLTLYHGGLEWSNAEFGKAGRDALWLTPEVSVAAGYADQYSPKDGREIRAFHVIMNNPLDLTKPEIIDQVFGEDDAPAPHEMARDRSLIEQALKYAKSNGYDGLIHPDSDNLNRYTNGRVSYAVFDKDQLQLAPLTGQEGESNTYGIALRGKPNESTAPDSGGAKQSVAAPAQNPRTLLGTITAAIDKAYPGLRPKLEAKGLLTIGQTLDEVTTAAAQARADKTGESVEDVKASMMGEVSNSTKPVQSLWLKYADSPNAFRFGNEAAMRSKDIAELAKAFSSKGIELEGYSDFDGLQTGVRIKGMPDFFMEFKSYPGGGDLVIDATRANGPVSISAGDNAGQRMYQVLFAYAHNNGKKVDSDFSLSPVNELRRTSAMLSSALRFGSLEHFGYVNDQQDIGEFNGDFDHDVNLIAGAELSKVQQRVKLSGSLEIDPTTGDVYSRVGPILEQSREAAGRAISVDGESFGSQQGRGRVNNLADLENRLASSKSSTRRSDRVQQNAGQAQTRNAVSVGYGAPVSRYRVSDSELARYLASIGGGFEAHGVGVSTLKRALITRDHSGTDVPGLLYSLQIKRSANGDIQGFFDPVTGQSFLIADNLTEQSAPGVLIHEVGVHMANDGTLEPVFTQALRLLKLGKGNPWFDGVRARLESAGETSGEEAAAYITETIENDRAAAPASVMKWFNDFKAAIKAWLFKKGVFISSEDLSAADIAAIARANAKSVAADGGSQGTGDAVSLSRSGPAPAGSWDAPPDSRIDKFLQKIQDGKIDLKRVQQAIVKSGKTIGEAFDARLAETLYAGRVATRADRFMKSEAQPLLEAMAKNNVTMDDLSDYLLARHAPERNAQIAKVNDEYPDGGAGSNSKGVLMTTQAANDYIANLTPGKRILFEMLAKKVDAISKGTRDLLVAEGLETQETIDNWVGAYKHYVPLFKDEANGESFAPHPIGSGFSVKGGASKRAMGSDKEVTNMLSHLLLQREAAITRAEKNRVGMALYGLALTQPNKDFWTTIKPNMKKADVEASLVAMGIDPAAYGDMDFAPMVKSISKTTGKVISTPNPLYKNLDNAIVLKVEGKDRVILFNKEDPRAMRLVQNLKNLDGVTGIDGALRVIGKPTRWISSLATQHNPAFGMVNLVRDTQGALTNLSSTKLAGKQFQVIGNMPAAISGIARELSGGKPTAMSTLYRQFQEDGGQTGYRDALRDPKERTQQIEKDLKHLADTGKLTPRNAAVAVLDLMDGFNTTLENGTRLAAYKVALDSGLSRPEAARLARELTVDFNRKGSYSLTVGPLYAFFNAAVQGTARTVETLKGPAGRKIIAGGFGLGVMQALMLVAAGYDDDEIAEFSKARALIIPRGDKKYISIPLPLGLHVLPNTGRVLTELAMSQGKEWDKKLFNAVGEIAGAFNPLGGGNVFTLDGAARTLAPTVIDPLVDLATGKDFSGTPISKAAMPGDPRPGYLRGRESTYRAPSGEVYTGIAKALNTLSGGDDFRKGYVSLTPEESRYIVMTIGGGLLREIEKATNASIMAAKGEDVPTRQIPLGSRFAGEVDDAAVQHRRYYTNSDKVSALEAELKALAKNGRSEDVDKLIADKPMVTLYKLNDKVKASITKLNKLASDNLGDKETMKSLDDARTENMRILNEAVRELERASAQP